MNGITSLIIALIALGVGLFAGSLFGERKARELNRTEREEAEAEAARILEQGRIEAKELHTDARSEAKDILQRAREDADRELQQGDRELQQRRNDAEKLEKRVAQREGKIAKKEESIDARERNLDSRASSFDRRESDLARREQSTKDQRESLKKRELKIQETVDKSEHKLAQIAGLSPDEARQLQMDRMVSEARTHASRLIKNIEEEAIAEADRRAKKVISIAIQRFAGEYVTEQCVSVVALPSDDMKGRIIGREGRNIRALEAATGINLIIDDTPEAVILSGFDPMRREIARIALERLIADGRIHPTRIEEVVERARSEVLQIVKEAGEQATFELGLHGVHVELLKLIGRLRYRTSYGQNMWSHSIEVGFLCGLMAAELGLNVKKARRAGLLHDIGKALTHEMEGSHALIGGDWCKKYGEDPIVTNAVAAHHEEVPAKSVYAHLVMAADALSGARPGARREVLENYVQRLEDLERISTSFQGVQKAYAIQAGREVRVIVSQDDISDDEAHLLSRDIARKIEEELIYPGQIKVCVIRETRAVDFAR